MKKTITKDFLKDFFLKFDILKALSHGAMRSFYLSHGMGCVDVSDTVHMV